VALPDHHRVRGGDAVDDAADVHVDDGVPLGDRQVLGLAAERDAGVVEHEVQPALALGDVGHERLDGGGVGDVERHRDRRAGPGGPGRGARRGVAVQVGAADGDTVADQRAHERAADPRAAAGDDRLPRARRVRGTHPNAPPNALPMWPRRSG
jgi:hypothetical protein